MAAPGCKETVSAICEELTIQPSAFYEWQSRLLDRGASVFGAPGRARPSRERESEEKVTKLEAKLTREDSVKHRARQARVTFLAPC